MGLRNELCWDVDLYRDQQVSSQSSVSRTSPMRKRLLCAPWELPGHTKATYFFCETHWTSALWELLPSASVAVEMRELETRFSPQR